MVRHLPLAAGDRDARADLHAAADPVAESNADLPPDVDARPAAHGLPDAYTLPDGDGLPDATALVTEKLTPRQREVLALTLALMDERRVAGTLGMAYATLRNHVRDIGERLGLESRFAEFKGLSVGARFSHGGVEHEKVPHMMDRLGGYNAQGGDGERRLFRRDEIVEVVHER